MSVPSQTPYNIYAANGLTTVFAYQFMIMTAGDLEVSVNGTPVASGFTVQGAGQTGGGQVIFTEPPANGAIVMLLRKLTIKRDTDYQDNGDLLAETINADFDRLWLAMQQVFLSDGLSLKRPLLGGPFNAGNLKIINLLDPTEKQDAATKGWVDLQYSVPTEEAKQAAEEAKEARNETVEIAEKFGDVDTAVTEAQAARDISINASGISVEAAARAETAKGAAEAIANTNSTFPDEPSGIAGTTSGQYFRTPQTPGSLYSFKYYLNNAGTAVLVAIQPGDGAIAYVNQGIYPANPSTIWEITNQFVIFSGGESGVYAEWDAYFIPCKKGDVFDYFGVINTATPGRVDAWIIQCDENKNYVSDLATHISDGSAYSQGIVSGTATQNGYVYVRVKNTANPGWYINFFKKNLVTSSEVGVAGGVAEFDMVKALADNGATIDYTGNANYYTTGTIIDLNGVVNNAAGNDWLAYYIPVVAGDKVTMSGTYGSTTAGQQMAYFIQLDNDKNFVEPLDIYVSTGSNNVQATRSGVASQDGIMYVRVRRMRLSVVLYYSVEAMQRNYKLLQDIYTLQVEVDDLKNRELTQVPFIGATLEMLPVKFDNCFNYNAAAYIQDNVVKSGDYIYVVGTQQGKTPVILQKNIMTGVWSKFDLSTVPGNPLASPTVQDSHNIYSMSVTKDGYLLVSGNMHVNNCRCIISTNPHDISAWQAITYTDSERVTYPRFVKYPDGTTQAYWREGLSSSGQYYSATFNDTTRLFGAKRQVIQTDLTVNAYEQRLGIDRFGRLHICFGLRESGAVADSNRGLFYARSSDKGATWMNAAGSVNYSLPLTELNSEKIADIALFTGYVNQCGGACDFSGRYHTAIWQNDENNLTQIMHIWFDGSVWQREIVSKFDFKMDVSKGLLDGSLSRPVVGCTRYNKTWIFYRTTEMGRSEQIRAIDVSTPGAPVEHVLTGFNAGFLELAINTNIIMDDNNVLMLATRGAIGFAQSDYARYTAESGYLLMAVMP